MPLPDKQPDACLLDAAQQRRILDRVLVGPVTGLLGELVRRLPNGNRRRPDEAACQLAIERRLRPMQVEIAERDETDRAGFAWPGSGLTVDDRRRLATMGNTTRLSTTQLLHHCVHVTHHLFQSILLEIMATSERTGVAVRDLLTTATDGNGHSARDGTPLPQTQSTGQPDASPETPEASTDASSRLADEASDEPCTVPSIPPLSMSKRTTATAPHEDIAHEAMTDERIEELEAQIQRLQETMDVLIESIDGFRDELVHTLRNLPDQLPPPLQIHSLPLDPTDSDFGERVNAIPQDVMARLREEAGRASTGGAAVATAAEGKPSAAPDAHERTGGSEPRRFARQGKLFG